MRWRFHVKFCVARTGEEQKSGAHDVVATLALIIFSIFMWLITQTNAVFHSRGTCYGIYVRRQPQNVWNRHPNGRAWSTIVYTDATLRACTIPRFKYAFPCKLRFRQSSYTLLEFLDSLFAGHTVTKCEYVPCAEICAVGSLFKSVSVVLRIAANTPSDL